MNTRITGVISPLRVCVLISRLTRLPGRRATMAPMTIWALNSDRNSGASANVRDTDLSTPSASDTA